MIDYLDADWIKQNFTKFLSSTTHLISAKAIKFTNSYSIYTRYIPHTGAMVPVIYSVNLPNG